MRNAIITTALFLSASLAAPAAEPVKTLAGGTEILGTDSPWRWYVAWRKPVVPAAAMKAAGKAAEEAPLPIVKLHGGRGTPDIQHLESAPPAGNWAEPDFDDADWPRQRGDFDAPHLSTGVLCLRGRFLVTDPAAVRRLSVTLGYRGGVIAYLNGKEVARGHMAAGKVDLMAPAQAYPDEAWVRSDGKMLPIDRRDRKGMTEDDVARIAKRNRALGPVEIPVSALRKGVNVLALELHRSDYHPVAAGWWVPANIVQGITKQWTPAGLSAVALVAEGSGAVPNAGLGRGLQVWQSDLHQRVERVPFGDPAEKVSPIRMIGARNGVYSGMVVVSGDAAFKGVKAQAGEFSGPGGAKISAAAVEVRYVTPGNVDQQDEWGRKTMVYNVLDAAAPAEAAFLGRKGTGGAALPVMLTVRVPKDAAPGDYRTTLTVSADGLAPAAVPVELRVAAWTLPEPRDFRFHLGMFQSPTTLARQYKVKEWSEEHWKLMEKSFALLGELGNDLVNIPLSDQTQFGNDEGMVWWIKKADGSYAHDFSVFERYIKLAKKHLGTVDYVALHLWHPGCWKLMPLDEKNTVTVIDEATGKRAMVQVPVFGSDAAKKFWKPVLDGCRERLAKEGLEKSMCLGVLCDATAPDQVFAMFKEIAPGLGWTRGCHSTTFASEPYGVKGGGTVVYHEFCYGLSLADPAKKFPKIWAMTGPGAAWFRGEWDYRLPPYGYRNAPERGLYCGTRGIGRLGLDLWRVPAQDDTGNGKTKYMGLFNRWPHSSVAGHGDPTICGVAHPGPDGAQPTLRFEMLREGIQEAEALIYIADAADNQAGKIGKDLADRCHALIVERVNVCRATQGMTEEFFAGWQDRSARLYSAAAEVAAKLGGK